MSHPISVQSCHTQFHALVEVWAQCLQSNGLPNDNEHWMHAYPCTSGSLAARWRGQKWVPRLDLIVFNCLTDCRTYVSSNWPRSRLYLNLSGTVIGTEYRKSLTKFTRCLLNFDNHSRNAVLILENQLFDEDLTVTKREKIHIFPHASWGQNDPLDGLANEMINWVSSPSSVHIFH